MTKNYRHCNKWVKIIQFVTHILKLLARHCS